MVGLYLLNLKYAFIQVDQTPLFYITTIITWLAFSVMPDIDQPGSIPAHYFNLGMLGIIAYALITKHNYDYALAASLVLIILLFIHHRTLIHSVLSGVILAIPVYYYFGPVIAVLAVVSYTTHLIIDGDFSIGWEHDWWRW